MGAADLRPGQVVISMAGRDQGRKLVVLKVLDDRYVLVADGELRKTQRPKRKNHVHLQPQNHVDRAVAAKLAEGKAVTDQEVRAALAQILEGGRHDDEEGRH